MSITPAGAINFSVNSSFQPSHIMQIAREVRVLYESSYKQAGNTVALEGSGGGWWWSGEADQTEPARWKTFLRDTSH